MADVKEDEKKKDVVDVFLRNWKEIVDGADNFHPYSTESNNIVRCGKGVQVTLNVDEQLYEKYVKNHKTVNIQLPEVCISYLNKITDSDNLKEFKKALTKFPEDANDEEEPVLEFLEDIMRACFKIYTSKLNIEDGESVFDSLFVYSFLKAVADAIAASSNISLADFRPGEAKLISMSNQLKKSELYKNDKCDYLADGIIKLYCLKEIEVLLLETSWHFNCMDKSKHSFDHHKGIFGSLAMLKNIADEFPSRKLDTFSTIKTYLLHAAGDTLSLWSACYKQDGQIYELWLENKLKIKPNIEDKAEVLPNFANFFWDMKCLICESVDAVLKLKEEHRVALVESKHLGQPLSDIIDPTILKLVEKDDKTGMASLGPFYYSK